MLINALQPCAPAKDPFGHARRPKTGRSHQIRAHLQHAGHPIANDWQYGGRLGSGGATRDGAAGGSSSPADSSPAAASLQQQSGTAGAELANADDPSAAAAAPPGAADGSAAACGAVVPLRKRAYGAADELERAAAAYLVDPQDRCQSHCIASFSNVMSALCFEASRKSHWQVICIALCDDWPW